MADYVNKSQSLHKLSSLKTNPEKLTNFIAFTRNFLINKGSNMF